MFYYNLYGRQIGSEIKLPCNTETMVSDKNVDVHIKKNTGSFKNEIEGLHWYSRRSFGALRSYDIGIGILLCVGSFFQILVKRNGNEILVYNSSNEYKELIPLYIIGLGMSIIHIINKKLPLHAAGVEINKKNIAIVAKKGTGKSTLLWEFVKKGYKISSDDCLPLDFSKLGVFASPSMSINAKLSKKSLLNLNVNFSKYQKVEYFSEKYWVPINSNNRSTEINPLGAIFLLDPTTDNEFKNKIQIEKVNGMKKSTKLLLENTHGLWAVSPNYIKGLSECYARIVNAIPIYKIKYYLSFDNLPLIIEEINNYIKNTEYEHKNV